jgi:AcrR family transcriptional regulator
MPRYFLGLGFMPEQEKSFQKKLRYHHGDLRACLIAAGVDILEREGVEALSLRATARATGVSQAAPYSHFSDKDALLAAIAETGFQRLALQMAEGAAGVRTVRERVERLILSYILFAQNNKSLFRLMFGRELADLKKFPTLAMTAGKGYALISAALATRKSATIDTRALTVSIWSLCHGLAGLVIDEKINPAQLGADSLEDFVTQTVAAFAQHLD